MIILFIIWTYLNMCTYTSRDLGTGIHTNRHTIILYIYIYILYTYMRAKGDWDFRISDLVTNPDGTDI